MGKGLRRNGSCTVLVAILRRLLGFLEALIECLARNPQAQGRNRLIAVGSLHGFIDQHLLDLFECGQLIGKADLPSFRGDGSR